MSQFIYERDGYSKEITREFFRSVYTYMCGALVITGVIAYYLGTGHKVILNNGTELPEFYVNYFMTANQGVSPLFYLVMFAPVGLGLLIQWGYRRLSMGVLLTAFVAYSICMGITLGTIFMVYTEAAIAQTFFVSAGAFAGMAILGYTTKTDLTKFGSLMYMIFIGMFVATFINFFVKSEGLDLMLSYLGVFVFTGLTAYYMQQLKGVAQDESLSGLDRSKLSLVGGLQLYILFINLFLSLLRILNSRD